jgi:hypothetical protein
MIMYNVHNVHKLWSLCALAMLWIRTVVTRHIQRNIFVTYLNKTVFAVHPFKGHKDFHAIRIVNFNFQSQVAQNTENKGTTHLRNADNQLSVNTADPTSRLDPSAKPLRDRQVA